MDEQAPLDWVVRFDKEQIEFKNFTSAVTYADSLALRRTLVKQIDPIQQMIDLVEDKRRMNYEFDSNSHRRADA